MTTLDGDGENVVPLQTASERLQARIDLARENVLGAAARGSADDALTLQRETASPAYRADDVDRIIASAPRLQRYLADPANAAVAHDDVHPLSAMERLHQVADGIYRGSWFSDVSDAWRSGQRQIEIARLENRSNPATWRVYDDRGPLSPAEQRRLANLEAQPDYQPGSIPGLVAQQLPQILGAFDAGGRRAAHDAANAWRDAYGDEPQPLTFRNMALSTALAPIAAVSTGAAATGGAVRGVVGFTYEQEAGAAYQEFRNYVDDQGRHLSPEMAGRYAARVGEINAAIEFIGLGGAAKLSGAEELAQRLTAPAVRAAIRRAGYRRAVSAALGRVGATALEEGATEALQEGNTVWQGILAQDEAGGRFQHATPDQIAERVWQAFEIGALVGGTLGSVPAAASLGFDVRDVHRMREQEAVINALGDISQASKLKQRSPGRFADAVNVLTRNGALSEFRIDGRRFEAYFQDQDLDPYKVADTLDGVGRDALQQAVETGGEIVIPSGTYASQIVGTPADEALRPHMRVGPDAMTPAEIKARMEIGVDLERASAEASRLYGEAQARAEANRDVFDHILAKLDETEAYTNSANRVAATLITSNLTAWAERAGVPLSQFVQALGLDFRGPFEATRTGSITRGVLGRLDNLSPSIPRNAAPRLRVRVARPRNAGGGVLIEHPKSEGQVKTSWGKVLNYRPGEDVIATSADDATDKWVVKKSIFDASYQPIEGQDGAFRKRTDIPYGWFPVNEPTMIATAEGPVLADPGDVVMIGAAGEMWPMKPGDFEKRYETFDDPIAFEQFAGPSAIGAPLHMLPLARTMEHDGKSKEEIWRATGWERAPDGGWRWEIDDTNATFKPGRRGAEIGGKSGDEFSITKGKLSDFLDFPELFAAYPEFKAIDLEVWIDPDNPNVGGGYTNPDPSALTFRDGGIILNANNRMQAFEMLMHELQHAIQFIEGFAGGGNYDMAVRLVNDPLRSKAREAYMRFVNVNLAEALKEAGVSSLDEADPILAQDVRKRVERRSVFEIYRSIAGEVEARAVQIRRGNAFGTRIVAPFPLVKEMRKLIPPSQSYDTPVSELLDRGKANEDFSVGFKSMAADAAGGAAEPLDGLARRVQSARSPDNGNEGAVRGGEGGERRSLEEALDRVVEKLPEPVVPAAHKTALRFGNASEIADLLALAEMGADRETLWAHPVMKRVEAHAEALQQTMTAEEFADINALRDHAFILNGRAATFDQIMTRGLEMARSYSANIKKERQAVIVVGNFGAGKSTFIEQIAAKIGAAVTDADAVKAFIPAYEDGYNTPAVGTESSFIRWRVRDALIADGSNIVVEHVGDKAEAVLNHKRELESVHGYTVKVVHVRVQADEAARRQIRRFIRTGRYIDPGAGRRVMDKDLVAISFDDMVASGALEAYLEINATPPPGQAIVTKASDADELIEAVRAGLRRNAPMGGQDAGTDGSGALFQEDGQDAQALDQSASRAGPRGSIFFGYDLENQINQAVINLFEARNLSTVFHEIGHLNLELLMTMGLREGAPEAIASDAKGVLDWFGLTSDQWQGMSLEERRPYHEQFAHGFETYLYEGKAPSVELRGVFAAIKSWMMAIYRQIDQIAAAFTKRYGRALSLTPDVRAAMDRMLATESAIAEAQKVQAADRVMTRAQFGGTDRQYERYLREIARARSEADDDLRSRTMAALYADRTRWWRGEERRVREAVALDVDQEPIRRAYDWLVNGIWRSEANGAVPEGLDEVRLSLASILENYGQAAIDKLPATLTKTDLNAMTDLVRQVKRGLNKRAPYRLAEALRRYAQQAGGIRDNNLELAAVLKDAKGYGRVVNDKSAVGLEDAIMAMWERGYFGPPPQKASGAEFFQAGDRPTIREFLDALADDLRGREVYSILDADEVEERRQWEAQRAWFDRHGIDVKTDTGAELAAKLKRMAIAEDTGGLDADLVASIFDGYALDDSQKIGSGQRLLDLLASLKPRHQEIAERTRARMLQEFGDPFADGTIAEEAMRAAHREARAHTIELELEAINRAAGGALPVNAAARDIAARQIEHMTVKQIRGYEWFLGNERREAKNALYALSRGDAAAAQQHKYMQLVNFHLYRLARKAADEMDVAQRYLRKFERPGVRENIDTDYLAQIDGLLEQFELKNITQRETRSRMSLGEWAADMEARGLGHLVDVDPRRLRDAMRRPFQKLPIDEARGLVETVKNIEHLGRLKEKLLAEKERREFRAVVGEAVAAMEATGPISQNLRKNYTPTPLQRTQEWLRVAHAQMTRMEFLFRYLDGHENGPVWNALWAPFARAADKETALMRDATTGMNAIWDRYSKREMARMATKRIDLPELVVRGPGEHATSFTKADVFCIALNWGNEGNRAALLDGFGWDEAQVQAALDRVLDERDWRSVQMVWDLIATFRDEAFQLHEDLTGVKPKAVAAAPVQTPYGELPGGYYPLKYDGRRNVRQSIDDLREQTLDNWGSSFSKAMTRTGHLQARVGSGGRPVKLSLSVFTEHVNNVAHDIAYRRAVIDATRIIEDPQFANSMIAVAGKPMYDQLRPWLQSIAADKADPTAWMWQFLQKLRGNVQIAAMGYRISTGVQQVTGLLQAVPEVGSLEMAGALAKLTANPSQMFAKASIIEGKSEFMRSRRQTLDRDIRETVERMDRKDVLYPIRHNAFALVGVFDWAVSATCWTAAYDKAMGGHVNGIDAGDEAASIAYGDSVVRRTQSAGLNQDLPAIMRGNQVNKLMTMFFSYFSVLYNWTSTEVMGLRKGRVSLPVFIANMALIYVISPFIAETLAGRLAPRGDEDDEDRDKRILSVLARYPFQTIPFVRDAANVLGTTFDYQLSPVESGPKMITRALQDAAQGKTFQSENSAKTAFNAAGYAFGLPTGQAWTTIDYLKDKVEGEEEGFDPVEAFVSDRR